MLCHGQSSCRIGNRDGDERAGAAWVVYIPVVQGHTGGHEISLENYGDPLGRTRTPQRRSPVRMDCRSGILS